MEQLFALLQ